MSTPTRPSKRRRRSVGAARRFVMRDVLHADDPPHRLALGAALGVFVAFTPTMGFQMVLVLILATIVRANRVVGMAVVWITNPATFITLYYACYVVGRKLLGRPPVGWRWWLELARPPEGWWPRVVFYWTRFADVAWPLWLGGILVGLAAALPAYLVVYWGVRTYRLRRWGQLVPPPADTAASPSPPSNSPAGTWAS